MNVKHQKIDTPTVGRLTKYLFKIQRKYKIGKFFGVGLVFGNGVGFQVRSV